MRITKCRSMFRSVLTFAVVDARSQLKESTTDMGATSAGELASHTAVSHLSVQTSILYQGVREQLLQARDILELGLEHVSIARQTVARSDGKSIADIGWVKVNTDIFRASYTAK